MKNYRGTQMFKILTPYVSCFCDAAEFTDQVKAEYPVVYIRGVDGSFYKHQRLSNNRHVRLKLKALPASVKLDPEDTPTIAEDFNFLPAGKVPIILFKQIVKFFKEVIRQKNSSLEAQAFILWNEALGYHISVPKQTVSGASVNFVYDAEAIPEGSILVVDIH